MLQYVDSFTCVVNDNKSAMVIRLYQQEPVVTGTDDDVENVEIIRHEIASIVMPYDCAISLSESLGELVERLKHEPIGE